MISPLQSEQLETVLKIWLATNISAHHFIPASYWENNVDLVRELLPQAEVFVYQSDDTIKGFIGITDGGYIAGIFVADTYQSQGIGQALLAYCKRRYTSLTLAVYAENEKARRFYEKNGFSVQAQQVNPDTGALEFEMRWEVS
jgi:putative acetyltransferase